MIEKLRKRPVEVETILWDGTEERAVEIKQWVGWARNLAGGERAFLLPREVFGDPGSARLWVAHNDSWSPLPVGYRVAKELDGSGFYPLSPEGAAAGYEMPGRTPTTARQWIFPMDSKADVVMPDGKHRYWSTHCRHDNHDLCKGMCKGCAAPCICGCGCGCNGVRTVEESTPEDQLIDEVIADAGSITEGDRELVARATGGAIRSVEIQPQYEDDPPVGEVVSGLPADELMEMLRTGKTSRDVLVETLGESAVAAAEAGRWADEPTVVPPVDALDEILNLVEEVALARVKAFNAGNRDDGPRAAQHSDRAKALRLSIAVQIEDVRASGVAEGRRQATAKRVERALAFEAAKAEERTEELTKERESYGRLALLYDAAVEAARLAEAGCYQRVVDAYNKGFNAGCMPTPKAAGEATEERTEEQRHDEVRIEMERG